jgi:hypothetical protein
VLTGHAPAANAGPAAILSFVLGTIAIGLAIYFTYGAKHSGIALAG